MLPDTHLALHHARTTELQAQATATACRGACA
ncbi:hypothetical protein SALBM311S_03017 [Streptomyces alboniger]